MIFISHSEKDRLAAGTLSGFLLDNLEITPGDLKSTCIHSTQLPDCRAVSKQLKSDIYNSEVVIALVSGGGPRSETVMFELGAAWALGKFIVIIFTAGSDFRDLPQPLGTYTDLSLDSKDAHIVFMDILREIADVTGAAIRKGGNTLALIERAIQILKKDSEPERPAPPPTVPFKVSQETNRITVNIADCIQPFLDQDVLKELGTAIRKDTTEKPKDTGIDIVYTVTNAIREEEVTIRFGWDELFRAMAPHLQEAREEAYVKNVVLRTCRERDAHFAKSLDARIFVNPVLESSCYARLMNRFASLGYFKTVRGPSSVFEKKNSKIYWQMTPAGFDHLNSLMSIRASLKKSGEDELSRAYEVKRNRRIM